jgi:hypothetical protein
MQTQDKGVRHISRPIAASNSCVYALSQNNPQNSSEGQRSKAHFKT